MSRSPLVNQAQNGDPNAIQALLQRSLHSQRIQVSVTAQQGCLDITLDADTVPDQAMLVAHIQRGLLRLRPQSIHSIRIQAVQPGFDWFAWNEVVELNPQDTSGQAAPPPSLADAPADSVLPPSPAPADPAPLPTPASRLARSRPIVTTPNRQTRPPQQDLGLLFLERFNPYKVALVAFLLLHTVFGSPNYTIQGFLTGRDWLMMFLHGVNLIFHEAGHVLFIVFGEFMTILGGSLMQILVPAVIGGYFFLTNQRFSGAIALWWVGQNFLDVSIYIRDARDRELPLIGGLDETAHDWHNIFLRLGLMRYDDLIANHAYGIGLIIYLIALSMGLYYARRQGSLAQPVLDAISRKPNYREPPHP